MELPQDYQVRFSPPRRSDAQNAKLHAMAADLSRQVPWCGQRLSVEQWKRFAIAKLKKDKIVFDCNEDGEPDPNAGLIVIGASTREMGVREMSDVMEWFYWMGAKHGVVWGDDVKKWSEL